MSTNHQDGGKLKLEKLLQCEVEQQQAKTDLHRMTLRNLATNGMFNGTMRLMQPGPAGIVQVLFYSLLFSRNNKAFFWRTIRKLNVNVRTTLIQKIRATVHYDHEIVRTLETHPKTMSWRTEIDYCVITGRHI